MDEAYARVFDQRAEDRLQQAETMEKVDQILLLTTYGTIVFTTLILALCLVVCICRFHVRKKQEKAYEALQKGSRLSSVSTFPTARTSTAGNRRNFADDIEKPNLDIYSTNKKKKELDDLEDFAATPSSKFGTADKFVEGVEMQELERPDRWADTVRDAATGRKMIGAAPSNGRATMDLDELYDKEIGNGRKKKTKKVKKKQAKG